MWVIWHWIFRFRLRINLYFKHTISNTTTTTNNNKNDEDDDDNVSSSVKRTNEWTNKYTQVNVAVVVSLLFSSFFLLTIDSILESCCCTMCYDKCDCDMFSLPNEHSCTHIACEVFCTFVLLIIRQSNVCAQCLSIRTKLVFGKTILHRIISVVYLIPTLAKTRVGRQPRWRAMALYLKAWGRLLFGFHSLLQQCNMR